MADFNGTSHIAQRPAGVTLGSAFSVALRVRTAVTNAKMCIVGREQVMGEGLSIRANCDKSGSTVSGGALLSQSVRIAMRDATGKSHIYAAVLPSLFDGQWHSLIVTRDAGSHALYLDGSQRSVALGTTTLTTESVPAVPLAAGALDIEESLVTEFFAGSLAELAVCGRALTAAEASMLAAGCSPLLLDALPACYWRMVAGDSGREVIGGETWSGAWAAGEHPQVFVPHASRWHRPDMASGCYELRDAVGRAPTLADAPRLVLPAGVELAALSGLTWAPQSRVHVTLHAANTVGRSNPADVTFLTDSDGKPWAAPTPVRALTATLSSGATVRLQWEYLETRGPLAQAQRFDVTLTPLGGQAGVSPLQVAATLSGAYAIETGPLAGGRWRASVAAVGAGGAMETVTTPVEFVVDAAPPAATVVGLEAV